MQLDTLLRQIDMSLKALESLNLYGISSGQRDGILKDINVHLSYLNGLKQTIVRFKDNLEGFIHKKKDGLQALLCDTKTSDSGMVSNFYRAIQLHSSNSLGEQLQDYTTMEVIVYARYLFERMDMDNRQMIHAFTKQLGQGIDIGLLNEVEHLVWMLVQVRHRLKLSSLGSSGILKESALVASKSRFDPKLSILTPSRYNGQLYDQLDSLYNPAADRNAMMTGNIVQGIRVGAMDFEDIISKASSAW